MGKECKMQGGYIKIEDDGIFVKQLWSKKKVFFKDIQGLNFLKDQGQFILIINGKIHGLFFNGQQAEDVEDVYKIIAQNTSCPDITEEFVASKSVGDFMEVDESRKKVAFALKGVVLGNKKRIVNFADIIGFEIIEDNELVVKGGIGSALMGGFLFGDVGAIVGGSTGNRKISSIVHSMELIVRVNNISNPTIKISLISSSIERRSKAYLRSKRIAQEAISVLNVITNGTQDTNKIRQPIKAEEGFSAADEILKYRRLLDIGAITDEEYENKKKQLLEL